MKKFMNNNMQTITFGAIWIFLCCYFMQFFDFPNRLTILFGSIICLGLLVKQKKFRLDIGCVLLTLTIASYHIILHGTRAFTMSLPYVGILMYVLGNYLSCEIKDDKDSDLKFVRLIFAVVAGYSIHGILNSWLFLAGEIQNDDIRLWMDVWVKWYMPGTRQVTFFLPALALVFPALIYFKNRKWINGLIVLTSIFFIYISLITQSRTSVIIFPIVFVAQIFLYVLLERKSLAQKISGKRIWIGVIITIVLLGAVVLLLKDNSVIVSFMEIMGRDGGVFNNIRFKIQRHALEQLFLYPMGGDQMDFLGYAHAHNAWLEMANSAGLIPFFSFTAYTVFSVYELIRWLMKKEISTEKKLMIAGIYGAFFLYYTIERLFEGSLPFLSPWVFINGLVHGELEKEKKRLSDK